MSLETIRRDVRDESVTIGAHVVQRMWEDGLSMDQVLDTILSGVVRKREKDERSEGRYTKFTMVKRNVAVVVKDCHPAFIITARRRK
jgi:hypothetical protein